MAQKDDKVYYFEDSYVKRSIFGIEASVNPGISSRNLIQAIQIDLGDDIYYTGGKASSQFAFGYGARLIIAPNNSIDIRLGVNVRSNSYKQKDILIVSPTDTARVDVTTRIKSLDFPIILAFKNELGSDWQLEYGVGWEFSLVKEYRTDFEIIDNTAGVDVPSFHTYTDNVEGVKHSLIIQMGGAYVLNPKTSFFMLPNFRYMFTPLITDGSQNKAAPFSIGLDMGIRYRF